MILLVEGAGNCVIDKCTNIKEGFFFQAPGIRNDRGMKSTGAEHETGYYRDNINLQE